MRILFFLESLQCGGKERRSLELMQYLSTRPGFEISLVLTEEEVYYQEVFNLNIKINIIQRRGSKYDPALFYKFIQICRRFKPDIIHSWGRMTTFYAIPAKIFCHKPLISNLISDSNKSFRRHSFYSYVLKTNIYFSDVILSNSVAGLNAYEISNPKARVIHNGVILERFSKLPEIEVVKKEYGITTRFMIIMVASFSHFKDYDFFLDTARENSRSRNDVTFVAVGDGEEWNRISERVKDEHIHNVILTGKQKNIERMVAAADVGMLCTESEGMSNSIIEYMAMGKPVITTDLTGGSRELVVEGETGFLTERNAERVSYLINNLLDNPEIRYSMGEKGKERIRAHFSIKSMGDKFESLYKDLLQVNSL